MASPNPACFTPFGVRPIAPYSRMSGAKNRGRIRRKGSSILRAGYRGLACAVFAKCEPELPHSGDSLHCSRQLVCPDAGRGSGLPRALAARSAGQAGGGLPTHRSSASTGRTPRARSHERALAICGGRPTPPFGGRLRRDESGTDSPGHALRGFGMRGFLGPRPEVAIRRTPGHREATGSFRKARNSFPFSIGLRVESIA